jgi:hypothetical protein
MWPTVLEGVSREDTFLADTNGIIRTSSTFFKFCSRAETDVPNSPAETELLHRRYVQARHYGRFGGCSRLTKAVASNAQIPLLRSRSIVEIHMSVISQTAVEQSHTHLPASGVTIQSDDASATLALNNVCKEEILLVA